MDKRVCLLLTCVIAIGYVESVLMPEDDSPKHRQTYHGHQNHHGHHHNHTRRVPSRLADLKDRVLQGYDKTMNPDHKVVVTMGFDLLDLHLCSHKQKLTLSSYFQMLWKDERLAWDKDCMEKANCSDEESINVSHEDIWIPDLIPYTLSDAMEVNFLPWNKVNAVLFKDGSVIFVPPVTMKTWCKPNLDNWPFGEQSCDINIGSWTYGGSQVDLDNMIINNRTDNTLPCSKDCMNIDNYQNSQIDILSTSAENVHKKYPPYPEIYPRLKINIKFQRNSKYEKGKLHCAQEPETNSLKYCNTAEDCPCGLNHCHNLLASSSDGNGVCTPNETKCKTDEDCTELGDIHGSGKLGARCRDKKCRYDLGILMA